MNSSEKINVKALSRKIKAYLGTEGDLETSISKIENITEALIKTIASYLKEKREIFLAGFGTFFIQRRKETRRRNPQNGKEIRIPASEVVKFRVFKTFSDKVFSKKLTEVRRKEHKEKHNEKKETNKKK